MAASKPSSLPPAIFLMGPTASGKTALAMELCQRLPCEIISVDSALVYRGLDVGSAKPTREEQQRYPHRLIDIRDPADIYSAADFYSDALREMAAIVRAGRIPLLVGGTMLYFKALLEGLAQMPAADAEVRAGIECDAARFGWAYIHGLLKEVDPLSASIIHPNHSQRLSRAYEVYLITGRPMSYWREQQQRHVLPYRVAQIAIAPREREVLHERIAQRFRLMMEQGLVDEVRALRRRQDLHPDLPAMRAVGYRQVWQYLDGEYSLEECVDKGVAATRQLAKRQLTWLRGWPELMWLHTDSAGVVVASDDSLNGQEVYESKPVDVALNYLSVTLGLDS